MTLPAPRLHPDPAIDPAPEPDDRGDWSLVLWVPTVFAVAGVGGAVRWLRWHVAGWLYAAADRVNTEAPIDRDALTARIARAVEAEAARDRGGAT